MGQQGMVKPRRKAQLGLRHEQVQAERPSLGRGFTACPTRSGAQLLSEHPRYVTQVRKSGPAPDGESVRAKKLHHLRKQLHQVSPPEYRRACLPQYVTPFSNRSSYTGPEEGTPL